MTTSVRCCVAGGGPAGVMLGLLLARAGVDVLVLEKHADFLRDFRGDTIHPSTLEVMHELGLLDDLLRLPHQEVRRLGARVGDEEIVLADFGDVARGPAGDPRTGCAGGAARACSASVTPRTRCRPSAASASYLAIQDAVAAANLLAAPLRDRRLTLADLERVQRRRAWPTRVTQRLQLAVQRRVIGRVLAGTGGALPASLALSLLTRFPILRRIPARLIGLGVRPEHVAPAAAAPRRRAASPRRCLTADGSRLEDSWRRR